WHEVADLLELNGVRMRHLPTDTMIDAEAYHIEDYNSSPRAYEKHHRNTSTKVTAIRQQIRCLKGDYYIPTDQTARRFLTEMLEPTGDDSYFSWNFFDAVLQEKEGYSDYRWEDIAAAWLKEHPGLREQLEEKKRSEASFAKDPEAQLYFIYRHSPYYEPAHLRYPVYRIPIEEGLSAGPGDPHIHYEGRIGRRNGAALFYWAGTSATVNFSGTGLSAEMEDADTSNYYNVIVDGSFFARIHTDRIRQNYVLVSGLPDGRHTLSLFKRTELYGGPTSFYGFLLDKGGKWLDPPSRHKKIEFYGNSITCGYADEDSSGRDRGVGRFENNYVSYAALTARHFDADYTCIAKSGIGITVSWFPLIMPEMYDRLDPSDPTSKWDFSSYRPDLVVINLFQNDSWLVEKPDHDQFRARFGTVKPDSGNMIHAYSSFLKSLRAKYPGIPIICSLGSMDATREGSPWPGYIRSAVNASGDKKIFTHFFPYKGTPGHPSTAVQKMMAESLIHFIEQTFKW
ncbi:MAG: SGNH/GDSL hydrolase family protein, partial [Bacteroidota bacterium]|nr:SGNH/GDSL hydrolase family protein [Bacteroidota bacterium]